MALKLILNEVLPADLRAALDEEAERENLTVNDVAARILCKRFNVEWQKSRTSFRPVAAQFKLRVSEDLHRLIRLRAALDDETVRGIVLSTLTEHYAVEPVNPRRRGRKETV